MTHLKNPANTDSSRGEFNPNTSHDDLMKMKVEGPAFGQVLTAEQVAANHERRQAELQAARRGRESIVIRQRIEELEAKARGEAVLSAGPTIVAINGQPTGKTA